MQMLDRLALSLVSLPESTYDLILILSDVDGSSTTSHTLFSQDVFRRLFLSLKAGGKIQTQSGRLMFPDHVHKEAVFAGFVVGDETLTKPGELDTQPVPLRLGKKQGAKAMTNAAGTGAVTLNSNGEKLSILGTSPRLNGVGYMNGDEEDSDEELIDENTLLCEEDMKRPIVQRKLHRPLRLSVVLM